MANVGNETTRQPESGSEQVDEELEPDPFEEAVEEQFSQPVVAAETPEEKEYSREDATVVSYPQSRFRKGVFVGAVAAILLLAGIICIWRWLAPASFCTVTCTSLAENRQAVIEKAEVAKPVSAAPAVIDTLPSSERIQPVENASNDREAAPTQPSDNDKNAKAEPEKKQKKVYDTITTKRFLTTMAKEHYGDYNLWPYIYDENAAILGHPDRIKPGTKVVIPPASKYGIDASNPACVAKAKSAEWKFIRGIGNAKRSRPSIAKRS